LLPVPVLLLAGLGSGLGAVGRYLVDQAFGDPTRSVLVINLSGSAALGLLIGLTASVSTFQPRHRFSRLIGFVGAGLLGGFTTFSTPMVATAAAAQVSSTALTQWATLLGLQVLIGVLLAWCGYRLGQLARS